MYKCDVCKEEFNFKEEVVFLSLGKEVSHEEDGGSGDIDKIVCGCCYEKQVYCTNCKHLKLEEIHKSKGDYIVSCPYEKECEIFDVDDSRPLSERPYYEEEI